MDIRLLVNLSARAWSLPILAHLQRGVPGRQAALLTATGAGRTAFGQSLDHLIALGLVERNPGHGHPLRPEYRMTKAGAVAARFAAAIESVHKQDAKLLRRAWTLPILAVTHQPVPFSGIRQQLAPITDRALSQNLQTLQKSQWIARDVDVDHAPPRPYYKATQVGRSISEICRTSGV